MPNSNGKILDKLTTKNIIYVLLIGMLCIALCGYDLRWIFPSIVIFSLTVAYTIWMGAKKKNEIANHIKDVTSDVSTASRGNLINTPIPLVLIETDGNIVWRSKKFVEEFQSVDISTYLTPIIKEIKMDIEKNNETIEICKQFNINKKSYKVRGSIVKTKRRELKKQKEYVLSLYFIDETRYNELFDAIGTAFGEGNKVTTFLVPENDINIIMQSGMAREQRMMLYFHSADTSLQDINNRTTIYHIESEVLYICNHKVYSSTVETYEISLKLHIVHIHSIKVNTTCCRVEKSHCYRNRCLELEVAAKKTSLHSHVKYLVSI